MPEDGLVTVVLALMGIMLALATQFESAWIGSPVRPWTRYAIPVALIGLVVTILTI